MATKQYRQGDILLVEMEASAADPTPGAKAVEDGIIARGEATGHAHRLEDLSAGMLVERDGTLYLKVTAPQTRIVHEEHGPITLTQGLYRVVRQREYTPGAIRSRTVAD